MGDDVVKSGRIRRPAGQPAVTPDMLWPAPKQVRQQPRPRRDDRTPRASRMNHPSVRASMPEPTVILGRGRQLVDLSDCGNGCGNGMWCMACRADIRAEALHWLRELNVPRPSGSGTVLSWKRAWNREVLLADH